MRNHKRSWSILALLIAFALLAAACGSDDDDSAADETSAGDETVDWSYRLRKFGGVISVNPAAVVTRDGAVFKLKADHVK